MRENELLLASDPSGLGKDQSAERPVAMARRGGPMYEIGKLPNGHWVARIDGEVIGTFGTPWSAQDAIHDHPKYKQKRYEP